MNTAIAPRSLATPQPTAKPPVALPARPPALRVVAPAQVPHKGWLRRTYDRLEDRLASLWLGKIDPRYAGQVGGPAGRLLARLAPNHGAMLTGLGTLTFPAAALAGWLPGGVALPDLGASLRGAAMVMRRPDGQLAVTLTLTADEAATYAFGPSVSLGLAFGQRTLGLKLGAETAVGADVGETVVVSLKFDPTKPEDARCLEQLLELGLAGAPRKGEPGLSAGAALSRALTYNRQAISLGGSLGGNAGITFGGTAGAAKDSGKGVAEDSPWRIKAKLGLTGTANGELFRTYARDGSIGYMIGFEGDGTAAVKLPSMVNGKLVERSAAALDVVHAADGTLSELSATFTESIGARVALDLGKVDPGLKGSGKTTVTRALNEQGLAEARKLIAAGKTPLAAYRELARNPKLVEEKRSSSLVTSGLLGFSFDASLAGHQLTWSGALSAGAVSRRSSDGSDPELREVLMLMAGSRAPIGF